MPATSIDSIATKNIFTGPNIGLLSMATNGEFFVCDSQHAYSVSLFDHHQQQQRGLMRIKFESQVNSIAAIVFPYIVAFSSSVIEIRNIETVRSLLLLLILE
jgi:uncharacterized UPF0160 family protein